MMTELSLNERAALAAGWTAAPANHTWKRPDGFHNNLLDCEHSFDAAYALLWPLVQMRGYSVIRIYPEEEPDPYFNYIQLSGANASNAGSGGYTIAAAFTNACLEVLEESDET